MKGVPIRFISITDPAYAEERDGMVIAPGTPEERFKRLWELSQFGYQLAHPGEVREQSILRRDTLRFRKVSG